MPMEALEYEIETETRFIEFLLRTNVIPFIPRGIDQFVDHGVEHIDEIMKKKDKLFLWCNNNGIYFNNVEKMIMRLSIYCHDLGCIIKRCDHGERSAEIIDLINNKLDKELINYIKTIVIHHSKNKSLDKIEVKKYKDYEIKIDLMISILRLSDALDAGSRSKHLNEYGNRAPPMLFKILTYYECLECKSIKHWIAHGSCKGVVLDIEENQIIITYECDENIELINDIIKNNIEEELSKIECVIEKYNLPILKVTLLKE